MQATSVHKPSASSLRLMPIADRLFPISGRNSMTDRRLGLSDKETALLLTRICLSVLRFSYKSSTFFRFLPP